MGNVHIGKFTETESRLVSCQVREVIGMELSGFHILFLKVQARKCYCIVK